MTPESQRIAIAEACGWKFFCLNSLNEHVYHGPNGEVASLEDSTHCLPDYLNDLNAMHKAEGAVIEPHFIEEYCTELYMVLEKFWTVDRWVTFTRMGINYAYTHATAAQRAEAFLRTIGKWVEE